MKTNEKLNPRWMKWLKKKKKELKYCTALWILFVLIILCKSYCWKNFCPKFRFFFFPSFMKNEKNFIIGTGIGNQKIFIPLEF